MKTSTAVQIINLLKDIKEPVFSCLGEGADEPETMLSRIQSKETIPGLAIGEQSRDNSEWNYVDVTEIDSSSFTLVSDAHPNEGITFLGNIEELSLKIRQLLKEADSE